MEKIQKLRTAKVLFAFASNDEEFILPLMHQLSERGFEVITLDDWYERQQKSSASEKMDGMVAFLTEASISSEFIMNELKMAQSATIGEIKDRFLFLLAEESISLPGFLHDQQVLRINRENPSGVIDQLDEAIEIFMKQKRGRQSAGGAQASSPLSESQQTTLQNYWLLKINGHNWQVDEFEKGQSAYYNTYHHLDQKVEDYDLFTQLKPGDRLLGYAYGKYNAVVCIFELARAVHKDPDVGEVITMKIEQVLDRRIDTHILSQKLGFSNELDASSFKKLFPLTKDLYAEILKNEPPTETSVYFNRATIAHVLADSSTVDIEDELDFESDVEALASVIAYKEVKPPLAVGLFGKWGSGKSFFMNKLQKRIRELSTSSQEAYCREVVQINFNSWHYSDSNLWASLITKIFDDLQHYGQDEADKLTRLFEHLNSTQELLADARVKKNNVDQEIASLVVRQKAVEEEISEKAKKLSNLSPEQLVDAVFKDPLVKNDLEGIQKEHEFLHLKEYKDIETNINLLRTGAGRVMETLQLAYSFRKNRLWYALVIAAAVIVGAHLLITNINIAWLERYKLLVISTAALVSQVAGFFGPAFKKVTGLYDRLKSLKTTFDAVELEKRKEFNANREELKALLETAQASQNELRQQVEQLESKRNQLQQDIDEIASGKKIVRFIESRITDERYVNSLGIISWIRKDFEELDYLLKQQYDALKRVELKREEVQNVFRIDRIILYIDDLDRCNEEIVVRVLEAIHLLLAFPLFVVVVGVDPRWMHNALTQKYNKFLVNGKEKQVEVTGKIEESPVGAATSHDYLEKIFQIPFALKEIDKTGRDNLIESQLQKQTGPAKETKHPGSSAGNIATGMSAVQGGNGNPAGTGSGNTLPADPTLNTPPPQHPKMEKKVMESPALLEISEEEIKFMQRIGFLIGRSPRTIKRYINMYRIIRTHARFAFLDKNEMDHYFAAMVLLAFITGLPGEARLIFDRIMLALDEELFGNFLKEYKTSSIDRELSQELQQLLHQMQFPKEGDVEIKRLDQIPMSRFKKNLPLISRFSFRDFMGSPAQNAKAAHF